MSPQAKAFQKAQAEAERHKREVFEQELSRLTEHASKVCEFPFKRPQLDFSQRGTMAGSARLQLNLIRLNPVLMSQDPELFAREILPHELAHLLIYQQYGKVAPHGVLWQQMMVKIFGIAAKRTHQLDVAKVQGKTYSYRCGCQKHELTIRRHNKILQGAQYRCRRCGEALAS